MNARPLASSFSLSAKSCPVSNRASRPEEKTKKQEHNDLFVQWIIQSETNGLKTKYSYVTIKTTDNNLFCAPGVDSFHD